VTALLRAGYAVRTATRRTVSLPNLVDKVIIPDLANRINWKPILRDVDIVVHLAGLAHTDERNLPFDEFDRINWLATLQLANAAKKARVKRFVFISSVRAQVGHFAAQIVRESDRPVPTDRYGISKLSAERAIRSVNLPFTTLRPVVVYGSHTKGNFRTLIRLASLPWPLPVKGLTARRSLLGIDNLISAIMFVQENERALGQTLLLADPTPYSLPEIIAMLRKAKGRGPGLVYFPPHFIRLGLHLLGKKSLWERINEDLVVDTSKLESFGWCPTVGTYEGFCSMLSGDDTNDISQNR